MAYDPLLASMSASGAWCSDAFTLASIPGMGAGAIATRPIAAGTPLFHLPLSYLLTPWTSALGPALAADGGKEAWESLADKGWAPLILAMMYESSLGDRSKWAGYLKTMPSEFGAPMWWSDEELEGLKGTDIEDRIGKASAHELYSTTLEPLMRSHPAVFPPSEHFTLHSFHVQGSRILSRSFTVPRTRAGGPPPGTDEDGDEEEEDEIAVMVPMADMLNAAYEMDNARLFADGGDDDDAEGVVENTEFGEGYTMITTKDIAAGEQIYNTYASPPNSELLRKYGHVDDLPLPDSILSLLTPGELGGHPFGNAGDDVEVPGDLVLAAAAGSGLEQRVEWWLEEGQEDVFSLGYPDEEDALPPAFIAFARLLSSDAEWTRAQSKGKLPRPTLDVTSSNIIGKAIAARRAKHVTTLEEDLAIIAGPPGRQRDAAVVRLGEKRVLGVMGRLVAAEEERLRKQEKDEAKAARSAKRKADDAGRAGKRRR
ncbi:SET domain-containing protein [Cutaneotrichosporon oleaginosum]|uniref:SET domain-containing protein n=1 Tax=Cutaneotrichosporon oleaginosum TaxID=879819 RepID=A0A0J0XKL6_9TREE|nr:SET domain-containing protein [Cutaneotrichosporon oleaginosum]KLT41635.1 SET domain-containing protein [Cutaneotrichosporon oleaginosum]TXT08128.1 hypothetical protein COLE_05052 [Cutaneotrichosporon oleaginosum]